jgi:Ca2+-binding EF-hand superfamily protein
MIPTAKYPPNEEMEERVQGHKRILQELQRAKLFRFQDWVDNDDDAFSTTNNRIRPSNGSTALVSMLRMGMRCQCGLMNAGSIRGNEVYKDQEWFTWSDLKAEIPYPTEMVASYIPGRVLQETIAYSRRGARETPVVARGGYIQVCSNIKFNDETLKIESIAGEPLDLDALYLTTLPAKFFMGIDNHVPLLEWAKGRCEENVTEECGRPAKVVIVELFSAILWLNMGSFDEIDTNSDGKLSRDEVKQRVVEIYGEQIADLVVDNIMSVADIDHSGYISPLEMMVVQFVATDMLNHVCTREELSVMRKVASEVLGQRPSHADMKRVIQELHRELDITKNGKVQRSEAMKALGSIRRRSLLE